MSETIIHHMALAFFGSAYAEQADEAGQSLSGEIMDQLPEDIDPAALHAATTLAADLTRANGCATLEAVFERAVDILGESEGQGDRPATEEMFGHYCAMQAMGHGVGLGDAFGSDVYDGIRVPYVEFGSHSLEQDYF